MKDLQNILNLTRGHNQYLEERIDLVASNSMISSFARLLDCFGDSPRSLPKSRRW